jgi:hypothetical protein
MFFAEHQPKHKPNRNLEKRAAAAPPNRFSRPRELSAASKLSDFPFRARESRPNPLRARTSTGFLLELKPLPRTRVPTPSRILFRGKLFRPPASKTLPAGALLILKRNEHKILL